MNKEMITKQFSKRLNEALDDLPDVPRDDGRQVAVGKMFGVSQAGARKWLKGESIPETWRTVEIVDKVMVSIEWLLTGKGPKYPAANPSAIESLTSLQRRYQSASPETRALIELALELPFSTPLPKSITPTLKTLIDGARMMAAQHLPKA